MLNSEENVTQPHTSVPEKDKESVWDYPRPPRLEPCTKSLRVIHNDVSIADTRHGKRVLETSHPPVYYFPPEDVRIEYLSAIAGSSFCEWKGIARYYDLNVDGKYAPRAAWTYPEPVPEFREIRNHFAFYCHLVDACFVGDEQARAQAGAFYGGWITDNIIGPFKGGAGTAGR